MLIWIVGLRGCPEGPTAVLGLAQFGGEVLAPQAVQRGGLTVVHTACLHTSRAVRRRYTGLI